MERSAATLQKKATITVIIPFHGNYCDFEDSCLNSLENQTFRDFEIIVVQDGPSCHRDKIKSALANSTLSSKYIINEKNSGALMSRIVASRQASGLYITCLDHDDSYPRNYLETLHHTAIEESYDVVECPVREIYSGKQPRVWYRFECGKVLVSDDILRSYFSMMSHNTVTNKLVRKAVWERATEELEREFGEFHLNYFEDALMTILIYRNAESYVGVCDTHYNHQVRDSGSNMTRSGLSAVSTTLPKLDLVFGYIVERFTPLFGYSVMKCYSNHEFRFALLHWNYILKNTEPATFRQLIHKATLWFKLLSMKVKFKIGPKLRQRCML